MYNIVIQQLHPVCSSQVYFLIPIMYVTHPPTSLLVTERTDVLYNWESVSWFVSLSLSSFAHLFYFLNSTYKWNHIVFVFLWLISLSIILSPSIHVVANGKISFFFMAEWCSIVYIYLIFLIQSSVMDTWAVSIIWLL